LGRPIEYWHLDKENRGCSDRALFIKSRGETGIAYEEKKGMGENIPAGGPSSQKARGQKKRSAGPACGQSESLTKSEIA